MFRYLGSLISYNPHNNNDITTIIAVASAVVAFKRDMAEPPAWHVQQVSPLLCHHNEPATLGCRDRDMVVAKNVTRPTQSLSPPKYPTHLPNLQDSSPRRPTPKQQNPQNVLLDSLHPKHDCSTTNGYTDHQTTHLAAYSRHAVTKNNKADQLGGGFNC
jgi:hypothetical protein